MRNLLNHTQYTFKFVHLLLKTFVSTRANEINKKKVPLRPQVPHKITWELEDSAAATSATIFNLLLLKTMTLFQV